MSRGTKYPSSGVATKKNAVKPSTGGASSTGSMKNTSRGGARSSASGSMPKQRVSAAGLKGTTKPGTNAGVRSPWGTKDDGLGLKMPLSAVKAPSSTRTDQSKPNSAPADVC